MGKATGTLKAYGYRLSTIAKYEDLNDPEKVKGFIANIEGSNAYRESYVKAYNWFVKIKGLQWERPKYKYETKIPFVPNTEKIERVIARSSSKYALVFRLLLECGMMPYELSQVKLRDIDLERGTLSVQGFKGHTSRIFKLKASTLDMLRVYLERYRENERLFPSSEAMQKAWTRVRDILTEKLKDPSIKAVNLYSLRHAYACKLYHQTRNILLVKEMLGHKKLETVMVYVRLLNLGEEEFTSAIAKTLNEACKLIEDGYEYVCEMDSVKIFRKRK